MNQKLPSPKKRTLEKKSKIIFDEIFEPLYISFYNESQTWTKIESDKTYEKQLKRTEIKGIETIQEDLQENEEEKSQNIFNDPFYQDVETIEEPDFNQSRI